MTLNKESSSRASADPCARFSTANFYGLSFMGHFTQFTVIRFNSAELACGSSAPRRRGSG